nr:MAG TPA: hypothetical protein [Caudoviricetes sp.]
MSDGIHIRGGRTWEEPVKPGRTLGTATDQDRHRRRRRDVYRPATGPARGRAGSAGRQGRTCTDRVGTFYVPPPAGAVEVGEPLQQAPAAGGLGAERPVAEYRGKVEACMPS